MVEEQQQFENLQNFQSFYDNAGIQGCFVTTFTFDQAEFVTLKAILIILAKQARLTFSQSETVSYKSIWNKWVSSR